MFGGYKNRILRKPLTLNQALINRAESNSAAGGTQAQAEKQLRFDDLPYVSINLLQLLRRGLGEAGFYAPLEYLGIGFVMVERE
jgi:hypothetical protein